MPIVSTPASYFGHTFATRKVLATLLDFFAKRIYVERYDENGDIFKYIRPPIHYSNRERFIALGQASNRQDTFNPEPALDLNYILPRMCLNISGMTYSPERKLIKSQRMRAQHVDESSGSLSRILSPVPYLLTIDLSILTKSIDDTFQIIEQIIPYFAPSISFDLKMLDGFDSESITYTLTSVVPDSNDEYGITDERIFLSTLSFETNVNYYYFKRDNSVIKQILVDYYIQKDDDYERIKRYEFNADNLAPVTTVATREDEPISQTIEEF